jgi:hypothetical protein
MLNAQNDKYDVTQKYKCLKETIMRLFKTVGSFCTYPTDTMLGKKKQENESLQSPTQMIRRTLVYGSAMCKYIQILFQLKQANICNA